MHRLWWWRRHATVRWGWLVATVAVLLVWQNASLSQAYWLGITATSALSLLVLAPGFAALTAWDARRLRAAGVEAQACRSWWSIGAASLAPVVMWSAVTLAVAVLLLAVRTGVSAGWPHGGLIALVLLAVSAFSLLGLLLGRWMTTTFAVPLAFAAAWLWLALPPTLTPFWIRNVTGHIGGSCCSLNQDLAPGALLAPTLVMLALLSSCALALVGYRRLMALAVSTAVLAGCLATARSLVQDFGADPVRDRVANMACAGRAPQVCVWPEHAHKLTIVEHEVRRTVARMVVAGAPAPTMVTERTTNEAGVWVAGFSGSDVRRWRTTVAEAPTRLLPPSCVNDRQGQWPADPAYAVVIGWLATTAELAPPVLVAIDPPTAAAVNRLASQPIAIRRAWYAAAMRAMSTCDTPAPPLPQ